ncbi:hypothetical protein KC19_11G087000 [Ceratodon purpureus]|uniref:HAT C-terminal dimerisation domain-containing protein n=1 Tax=Ceratodon purpureus TaxID=3225 RepID=A0A8T0GEH0_CERPU|nr:hypothetical protein KC19_11G087000 [Ceratodon purpureus]
MEEVVGQLGSGGHVEEHGTQTHMDGTMMDAGRREAEAMEVEEDHMGDGEKEDDKNYKEGPWEVLEMLVLVSGMKEYAERVGGHHEEVHEQQKWETIENYVCGQLVQRSALDCHEKWASLSGEFKRIKDFEVNMLQDQKSYWEMTFDEKNNAHLPSDFSQEVYNALWQWDDRDRIGYGSIGMVDDASIKDHTPLRTMGRSRKRTTDRVETDTPRKSSRGEGSMESTFLGSQLMMFGTQQVGVGGEGIGALAEVPEDIQPSEDDEVWNGHFAQLRANQQFWAPHGRASATWAFYVVNDNSEPDSAHPQQMRCAICHPAQQEHRPNSATRVRKGVVTYNKQHGTTSMKKHVAQEHGDIFTKYKATRKPNVLTRSEGQQPRRMKKDPSPLLLTDFMSNPSPGKKSDPAQERLLEDLVLYVAKGCHPMSMVDNVWLRRLVMRQCGRVNFPAGRQLADEVIPRMVSQTMEKYILPALAGCVTATASFDLWMSRRGVNTVALVIHFINEQWVPCRVTIGVFEAPDVAGAALAVEVKELLNSFNLTDKIIAFVVDDDSRLGSLISALSSMVLCAPLQLPEPYSGTCFGHVMFKACENATTDEKVCSRMREVSIDTAIATLKKTISWTTTSENRKQDWLKACVDAGLHPRKLRTPIKGRFASKVILFQEALDYQHAFSYFMTNDILSELPGLETWTVAKAVTDALIPMVQQCVTNQSKGYWLLSDALASALGLCIQLHKEQIEKGLVSPKLETGNFDSELEVLQSRMMSEVINALAPFLSFTVSYSAKHAHNMLALMLDPRYKGLSLVKDYVGRERALQVVAETDANALLPSLVTVFKQLNPSSIENAPALSPSSKDSVDDNSLFGSTASNDEAIVGHLKAELSLFRRLHIDPKECENPLAWWKDREVQFPNVGFLARQILGIVGTQVETERIFSVAGLITAVRRRHIGPDNLNKLVMIRENWPEDPRAGRKAVESGLEGYLFAEENILADNEDLVMESGLLEE